VDIECVTVESPRWIDERRVIEVVIANRDTTRGG